MRRALVPRELRVQDIYGRTSDTTYLSIGFRKSTPSQNIDLNILIRNSQQSVENNVGELTFSN
jgi:hypothetical protein